MNNNVNSFRGNVMHLLGDEKCFNFEYNEGTGEFGIGMVEGKREGRRFVDLSWNKEKWSEYVESWVTSEVSDIDVVRNRVFLVRNKKRNLKKERIEKCKIENNLECKICLSTYRLFYVEETEDFMCCAKKKRRVIEKVQGEKEKEKEGQQEKEKEKEEGEKMEEDGKEKEKEGEKEGEKEKEKETEKEKEKEKNKEEKRMEKYREWHKTRLEDIFREYPSGIVPVAK
eukprot:TRINITY_DN585_c0_g1_i1.p1 TRINITY_DN585_c0_g1~~TRINITY_DN585_c0_g1_i1.p1  ORF type:complete len:227 (+),score=114.98 TRINITY_DN585_c0_g1_i1:2-682(+)